SLSFTVSGAYEVNRTLSPTLTCSGARLPSSRIRPSPTAITLPREGLSLAESGSTMPPAVRSSAFSRSTTTRSPKGCSLTLLGDDDFFLGLLVAVDITLSCLRNSNVLTDVRPGSTKGISRQAAKCGNSFSVVEAVMQVADQELKASCKLFCGRGFWL